MYKRSLTLTLFVTLMAFGLQAQQSLTDLMVGTWKGYYEKNPESTWTMEITKTGESIQVTSKSVEGTVKNELKAENPNKWVGTSETMEGMPMDLVVTTAADGKSLKQVVTIKEENQKVVDEVKVVNDNKMKGLRTVYQGGEKAAEATFYLERQ